MGAQVEDNKLALSVHFRNVVDDDDDDHENTKACNNGGNSSKNNAKGVGKVFAAAQRQALKHPQQLELRHGKMVLELRPKMKWNKGAAVLFILDKVMMKRRSAPVL